MSGSATYAVQKYTLATMISSATSYDYIMARNSQRQLISTDFRNDTPTEQRSQIEADCRTILEEHQENTLGSCQWIRMDSGHVYLLRDVYDTQPCGIWVLLCCTFASRFSRRAALRRIPASCFWIRTGISDLYRHGAAGGNDG